MFTVENLRFTYPKNKKETIKGLSFSIGRGEIFGFLGPSGAGKSTTQKIMTRILTNYDGTIAFQGKDISELDDSFYEDIGVSFEMPIHFSRMTGQENIDFFLKLYEKKADTESLLKRVGLWDDRDRMVGEYSKGMKIRLNFVRALLNEPEMLFLDEPTNGLDPTNAMTIKDMIREFRANGGTVFLTSHIMSDVDQLCDRVAFIVDGRIIEMDSPRNLKLKYGKRTLRLEYRENGATTIREFPMDGIGGNETFLSLLRTKEIETIHSGETSLEDIFIRVTGVGLTDG
ncbi:MAG: ABC transporter ATP-binding protein [Acholeplasmataceae bacterium]